MSPRGLFVTGTDTGVGKTVVSCALLRALRAHGRRVAAMKPVASGSARTPQGLRNEDAVELARAAGSSAPYEAINPYCFQPAISPHIAAEEAGIEINIDRIKAGFEELGRDADWAIAEGAGGWLAPLGRGLSMADLAVSLGQPVLLVVGVRLGCLNHADLTRRAIAQAGVPWAGWAANLIDPQMARVDENLATLAQLLGEAPAATMPFAGAAADPGIVAPAAALLAAHCERLATS